MADSKISDYSALTGANIAAGDLFELVDVSDTSLAATGTNKKTTAADLQTLAKAGLGITTIASGSIAAAATQDITNIPATYAALHLKVVGMSSGTATRHPRIQLDSDNGASFDSTAGNYPGYTIIITGPALTTNSEASLCNTWGGDQSAATTFSCDITIWGYQGGPHLQWMARHKNTTTAEEWITFGTYVGTTSAINAIRLLWSGSGNSDAGTYALYGVN